MLWECFGSAITFFLLVITKLRRKLGENPTTKTIPRCSWAQSQTQNDLSGTPKVTGVLDNMRSSIVLAKMQHGKFALVNKHFSYFNGSGSETKTGLTTEGKNENCYQTAHPF